MKTITVPAPAWSTGWTVLILTAAARGYLAFALTLIATATLPAVGPCDSFVVLTGSMAPLIEQGDVVLVTALDAGEDVPMGRVVAFRAAAPPPRNTEVVIHRVVAQRPDGDFTTAGDANRDTDSAALQGDAVIGRARVLVPWAGLPVLWWHQGAIVVLALWLLLTALAVALVVTGYRTRGPTDPGGEPPPDAPDPGPSDRAAAEQPNWVHTLFDTPLIRRGRWPAAMVVCVLIAGGALQAGGAAAGFTAEARDAGNSWAMSKAVPSYTAQVLADQPWGYYLLDETAGPAMKDASGNGRNGTFTAPITYHQSGALTSTTSYSITLAGAGARAVAGTATAATGGLKVYSLELWFKTTTTTGGKLIGFESSTAATSNRADRQVFMGNDGKLTYGGWTSGGSTQTVTTPAAYNDGVWHYLVVTAQPNDERQRSTIYLDGVAVATGTTSKVSEYTGYWRLGYGTLPNGSGYPTSANFAGSLDNAAIYTTVLSPARVTAHYAAR